MLITSCETKTFNKQASGAYFCFWDFAIFQPDNRTQMHDRNTMMSNL